jgi:hypothetical protein
MKREKLREIARQAMEDMAQEARFRPEDHQVLLKHKDRLLALTDELVKAFYDSLFATPNTRKVFHEGERPNREKTLRDWWQRTVEGPVDEDYWAWQAYVGLIHVKRVVTNPMMVGQAFLIENVVRRHVNELEVVEALGRLMATVAAIIAYGYEKIQLLSVEEATGIGQDLIRTNVRAPGRPLRRECGSPPSRKFPFAQGKAPEGPGAGAGVHGVAADPRGSPHKPRKERRGEGASRGWKGMRPGGPQAGSGSGVRPSPARPPTAASKGPRRPGKRGGGREGLPPHTPRLLGPLRAGSRGGESGILPSWTAKMADLRGRARAWVPPPTTPLPYPGCPGECWFDFTDQKPRRKGRGVAPPAPPA